MILLDTHVWIWWVNGLLERIPQAERELIARAPTLAVTAMSCLEMAWLVRRGRVELEIPLAHWFDLALEGSDIQLVPLTPRLAERAAELPEHHKDPADRVIIATAIEHHFRLISLDDKFPLYTELGELLLPVR